MQKSNPPPIIPFTIGLCCGIVFHFCTNLLSDNNEVISEESSTGLYDKQTENKSVHIKSECGKIVSTTQGQKYQAGKPNNQISSNNINKEQSNANDNQIEEDSYKILTHYPPPHVTEPVFFGIDPNDEEVLQKRELALEDLIYSMEEANIPPEDIEATISAYRQDIEERYASIDHSGNSNEPAPSLEVQASDLFESLMNDTDEPSESVDKIFEDMLQSGSSDQVDELTSQPAPEHREDQNMQQ